MRVCMVAVVCVWWWCECVWWCMYGGGVSVCMVVV